MDQINLPQLDLPRVVIIGGGFAGLKLANALNPKLAQIVLLDQQNFLIAADEQLGAGQHSRLQQMTRAQTGIVNPNDHRK